MTDGVFIDRTAAVALIDRMANSADVLGVAYRTLSTMVVQLPISGAELLGIAADVEAIRRSIDDEIELLRNLLQALAIADVLLVEHGDRREAPPPRPSLMEAAIPFIAGRVVDAVTVADAVIDIVARPWSDAIEAPTDGPIGAAAAGDPGGTYELRPLAPFATTGTTGADGGRATLVDLVAETGSTRARIAPDEFELIRNDAETWTVILPGVTDLRAPRSGLDPHHRSVRDLDAAAVAASIDPDPGADPYARMVADAVTSVGVPPGASLLVVGHSYGAGAAVRLAADREFNGRRFRVTHVLAAGYHVDPWLGHVPATTAVLSVENRLDLVVATERAVHELRSPSLPGPVGVPLRPPTEDRRVIRFNGGWSDAGHHQRHYEGFLATTTSPTVQGFVDGVAAAGYARPGAAWAVDVSVPDDRHPLSVARE